MLRTLRQRLIVSHLLPLLVTISLVSIALVYALETRVLLVNLSRELEAQAVLFAEVAHDYTEIWEDPSRAQVFVARFGPSLTARVMLLTPDGRLLASSDPADFERLGRHLAGFDAASVQDGRVSVRTAYGGLDGSDIAEVLVPVVGDDQEMLGVIRLSRQLTTFQEWFLRARYAIIGVLAVGLLVGAVAGLLLALNVERPLQRVTGAIYGFSSGRKLTPLAEEGPAEVRLLVRAFNSLVQRLQDQEEARRQLLANLVHELGRPLGALYSATQALLAGADSEAALRQEMLEGMQKELEGLERLVADLARLRDRVVGALELNRRPLVLGTWLPQVLAPWREAAQTKGLQWQATVPSDLPALEADPERLAQAVGNLLDNAVKYTPLGGKVSVNAGVRDELICIEVQDTGPGIPPEEQERIFSPFYRAQRGRRFPQGMGLGLTIARDVVTAHGGRLEVQSEPGQGSLFRIRIPLVPKGE